MRALRTVLVVLLVSLGFLGGYFVGWYVHGENVVSLTRAQQDAATKAGDLQRRVIQELEGRYYKPVDVDKLSEAGIDGTLKSLDDPWTVYLSPKEAADFAEKESGQYVGIGATLQKKDGGLVITSVFDGSPAAGAGFKPGDTIMAVDGKPTADMAIDAAIARIKGSEGTTVRLTVKPAGGGAEKDYTVTRRRIEIPETADRMERTGGVKVGYVQLFQFGGFAARDVRRDVESLTQKGAESFILDLRFNGGGLLSEAVDVTGVFQNGVVTSTKGLHSPLEVLKATGLVATKRPLVVLVNGFSASASEIVTGALKDHERATVIGTQTFGKGLVQSIVLLGDGSALKLTTAVYYTPDGTNINKKGITPDIIVKDDPKTKKKDEVLQRALAYLAGQG